MKPRTQEFIEKLSELCKEYQAYLFYTNGDDGIHVTCPGDRDVRLGFDPEHFTNPRP